MEGREEGQARLGGVRRARSGSLDRAGGCAQARPFRPLCASARVHTCGTSLMQEKAACGNVAPMCEGVHVRVRVRVQIARGINIKHVHEFIMSSRPWK